jgi:hypothetical protein
MERVKEIFGSFICEGIEDQFDICKLNNMFCYCCLKLEVYRAVFARYLLLRGQC